MVKRTPWKHVEDEAARDALLEKTAVKRWLRGIAADNRLKELNVLHRFLLFRRQNRLEADPDRLVEEVAGGTNETRRQHLQVLTDWLEGRRETDFAYCKARTVRGYYRSVRSFYLHNLVDLPRHSLGVRDTNAESEVEVSTEPTADEFLKLAKRVLDSGKLSPRDRSIVLTKVQGLFDNKVLCTVFNYVAFPQLVKHFGTDDFLLWDEKKVPVKIDVMRTKTGYRHFTFIDRDAIVALKEWLAVREGIAGRVRIYPSSNPKVLPRSDPIYVLKSDGQVRPLRSIYVSTLFNRFGKRTGVNVTPVGDNLPREKGGRRRYPFHAHEVRDTGITVARSAGVPREVVEYFAGHNIDRMGYDKSPANDPQHFEMMYSRLARYLNIVSGAHERLQAEYDRKLEDQVRERDRRIDDLRTQVTAIQRSDKERAAQFQKSLAELERIKAGLRKRP